MTAIPPSRYQVVERGRRLVVIDRASGGEVNPVAPEPSRRDPAGAAVPAPPALLARLVPTPQQEGFDGRAVLVTSKIYDDRGPRTLKLDPGGAALIGRIKLGAVLAAFVTVIVAVSWPWVLAVPFVLLNDAVRKPLRRQATSWLDRYDDGRGGR